MRVKSQRGISKELSCAGSPRDGVVYHTYSTYARGLDGLWGMYQWLDRAPKGRNETGVWWRRHDEYGLLPRAAGSCCHAAEAHA